MLSNALKFTSSGKIGLEIEFDKETKNLIFKVIDSGMGISPETKAKMGKPYFKTLTNNNDFGIGMGFYLVKKHVEFLNGKFEIISELKKGTKIVLEFPYDIELKEKLFSNSEKSLESRLDKYKSRRSFVSVEPDSIRLYYDNAEKEKSSMSQNTMLDFNENKLKLKINKEDMGNKKNLSSKYNLKNFNNENNFDKNNINNKQKNNKLNIKNINNIKINNNNNNDSDNDKENQSFSATYYLDSSKSSRRRSCPLVKSEENLVLDYCLEENEKNQSGSKKYNIVYNMFNNFKYFNIPLRKKNRKRFGKKSLSAKHFKNRKKNSKHSICFSNKNFLNYSNKKLIETNFNDCCRSESKEIFNSEANSPPNFFYNSDNENRHLKKIQKKFSYTEIDFCSKINLDNKNDVKNNFNINNVNNNSSNKISNNNYNHNNNNYIKKAKSEEINSNTLCEIYNTKNSSSLITKQNSIINFYLQNLSNYINNDSNSKLLLCVSNTHSSNANQNQINSINNNNTKTNTNIINNNISVFNNSNNIHSGYNTVLMDESAINRNLLAIKSEERNCVQLFTRSFSDPENCESN